MRSYLFVPGDSEAKMAKALGSGADVLILDLEDSVAPASKADARLRTADFLAANRGKDGPALYVRVNALDTGLTDQDIETVVAAGPAGLVLPKSRSGSDVALVSALVAAAEADAGLDDGSVALMPIATETAAAVFNLGSYAGCSARLAVLTWGAEDLSADIGAETAREENGDYSGPFALVRNLCLMGAAAAGVDAVDTVYTAYRDADGLRRECEVARRDGFAGKMAIHPAQVAVINEVFQPNAEAIERARRIVAHFAESGDGVTGMDGEMLDMPHLRRAQRLLARAGIG
ncbi:MAG: CoA ester lyase [Flavobacteriaceae bacterium]